MRLRIGGVHTPTEQEKLAADLRKQLAPLIPKVDWIPRSEMLQRRFPHVEVYDVEPEVFARTRPVLELALSLNARYNPTFEHMKAKVGILAT